jgi:hypothetical protein
MSSDSLLRFLDAWRQMMGWLCERVAAYGRGVVPIDTMAR